MRQGWAKRTPPARPVPFSTTSRRQGWAKRTPSAASSSRGMEVLNFVFISVACAKVRAWNLAIPEQFGCRCGAGFRVGQRVSPAPPDRWIDCRTPGRRDALPYFQVHGEKAPCREVAAALLPLSPSLSPRSAGGAREKPPVAVSSARPYLRMANILARGLARLVACAHKHGRAHGNASTRRVPGGRDRRLLRTALVTG